MGNWPLNSEAGDSRELLGTRGPRNPCRTAGKYQVTLTCHFAITNVIIRWHVCMQKQQVQYKDCLMFRLGSEGNDTRAPVGHVLTSHFSFVISPCLSPPLLPSLST